MPSIAIVAHLNIQSVWDTEGLSFERFYGNYKVAQTLLAMTRQQRIPQTILLDGPEGVGKATLARRFAAAILGRGAIGGADKIEQDDLSLEANAETIAEREKWPSDRRNEDPLLFGSHPDFLTFPPDGPLRQITIEQMRLLKQRAQFKPLHGTRRVFLIDHIDRANEQAENSLLKILEEPPDHLILLLSAENPYDLLPTIRSRAISFHLAPLANTEMLAFVASRGLSDTERRIALAAGSPGLAVSMDLDVYDERRTSMLKLLEVAAGRAPCRHCLKLIRKGEEQLLLFTYDPFRELGEPPLPGPVYIHATECLRHPESAVIPEEYRGRQLTLEGYGENRALVKEIRVSDGREEQVALQLFREARIRYVNVRSTEAGCFLFRLERP